MITLVAPPLDGATTGGTLYNRSLVRALARLREPVEVLSWVQAQAAVAEPRPRTAWVDSLWLDRLPALVDRASPRCRVGLLAHYLPVLVAHGERPPPQHLTAAEAAALERAEAFVVPSEYLAAELGALGVDRARVHVVEPGTELPCAPFPAPPRPASEPVRAVVLANVTEGKGILPLLHGLAACLHHDDALALWVVGDLRMDPAHADACTALVTRTPALRSRVRWLGALPYLACIEALLQADVLLSASRMESYGMALADARACGRPIVARPGGNAAAHVDPARGGWLVSDALALAEACVALTRDRTMLHQRQQRAWAGRSSRPWAAAAADMISATRGGPPPRPPQ